ncbi:sulfatase [Flintibacter sp. P01028]|uniref:sulfatase family protein n=1 Tax=Flintibacter sp. P01028 TaxID=3342382 RepID=UPI0035B64330
MEKKRPNILFIMTDQFRADAMSCTGGCAHTPALDRLAAEGIRFTQCHTVSPLCVPARVSMMTGLYPHTTGVWKNSDFVLSPDANLWVRAIRDSGYATSVFGKLHLHTDYGDFIQREYLVNGYGFETVNEVSGPHSTCQTRTHMSEEWSKRGLWDMFCEDMLSRSKRPYAKPSPLSPEDYYDTYVGRKAREYLEQYTDDRPWFCHVSFPGPHEPWDAPKPYSDLYSPEDMPDPLPRTMDGAPDRPQGEYDKLLQNPIIQCSNAESKEIQANYCGSVTLIDDLIGSIIETIKKRGEWDNTIVLFTSDHGEMNGDHGFVHKRNFFRSAMNIPLIIRTPDRAKNGGSVNHSLVSLLDVGPTLAEFAGAELNYEQFGKSLCGNIANPERVHRDCILGEYACEHMLYDGTWKIALNRQGETYLLFDEANDPTEHKNLAAMPEHRQTDAALRERLLCAVMQNNRLAPSLLQLAPQSETEAFHRCVAVE